MTASEAIAALAATASIALDRADDVVNAAAGSELLDADRRSLEQALVDLAGATQAVALVMFPKTS
jgi:hypothetical protein